MKINIRLGGRLVMDFSFLVLIFIGLVLQFFAVAQDDVRMSAIKHREKRMIGGQEVSFSPRKFPSVVSIWVNRTDFEGLVLLCTGVIFNMITVVTAASCFQFYPLDQNHIKFIAVGGVTSFNDLQHLERGIEIISISIPQDYIHVQWNDAPENNIAFATLKSYFSESKGHVERAFFPNFRLQEFDVVGWGHDNEHSTEIKLRCMNVKEDEILSTQKKTFKKFGINGYYYFAIHLPKNKTLLGADYGAPAFGKNDGFVYGIFVGSYDTENYYIFMKQRKIAMIWNSRNFRQIYPIEQRRVTYK